MLNISTHFHSFLNFLKSIDFSRGVLMALAAISALVITNYFGNMNIGVAMAIGALLSSPSDVAGSFRRRTLGIFISVFLAVFTSFVVGYASQMPVLIIPVLIILTFSFSLAAVYGFRASLIAFTGLFAMVLSLADIPSSDSVLVHSLYIGLGGLWYLSLSIALHYINPGKQSEMLLSEGFKLTAEYLEIRADLIAASSEERKGLKNRLSVLQSDINDKHETIRELVIAKRAKSGRSGDARKKMLIFIEMVDILELSMANPLNYEEMEVLFANHQEKLKIVKDWTLLMVEELNSISGIIKNGKEYYPNPDLETFRLQAINSLAASVEDERNSISSHAMLVLRNLIDYKEKQQEKIISISRLLRDVKMGEDLMMKDKDAAKFITGQEYSLKTMQDNLDLKSPIFRHALRLTVVMVSGYVIGSVFDVQNTYWILLTILVIMRPGYALTKDRSKQRLIGTLIGGAIAVSVVLVTQNLVVYGILAVISLVFAISTLQRNYKASAIFITLNIVLVYSLMRPDPFLVIRFRLLDTLIGAGLAFLGNAFLWPTWEYRGIKNFIVESIKANSAYLEEINSFYQTKHTMTTSYKLTRKRAFLAIGNLNAAFQRMTQEPKSKQKEGSSIYEIVSLNQEFLSSAASLGTFIRTHDTTEASEHFRAYTAAIQNNLLRILAILEENKIEEIRDEKEVEQALKYFDEKYREVLESRSHEIREGQRRFNSGMHSEFQEIQMVRDQLKWLLQISKSLEVMVKKGIN